MAILVVLGFFGSWIGSTIFCGWVLKILWGWFIVPTFGLPILSIPSAIGFSLVIRYVCWPGYRHLKKECKIDSGRDMKKAIDKLVEEKLIGTWMVGNKRHYQVL